MKQSQHKLLGLLIAVVLLDSAIGAKPDKPYGLEKRTPWTTSNVTGTPGPPPPYRTVRVFPKLSFYQPTVITSAPGTDRLFVAQNNGKVFSFPNDPTCDKADAFADFKEHVKTLDAGKDELAFTAVYGLTFHPNFAENQLCYVCYVIHNRDRGKGQREGGTRVSRFKVSSTDPPTCDLSSEKVIISWLQGGHNGGCIKFGLDGCLYISAGDGGFAFPPDGRNSGQDVSNLLSTVMRIDVDHESDGLPYTIPADNPLLKYEGARGEIWSYGFRNPWKMSFDRKTGDLWVGDVGWELWELVYRVRPGDNFGWSLVEGRQPVHRERERGPTLIVPPTQDISHVDGASITGGFVYRGKKFPELDGHYIFGDWETRRIWGAKWDEKKEQLAMRRDLVEPTVRIVAFAEDSDGELYLMDYDDGTIHQFRKNIIDEVRKPFPTRLTETGLFESVPDHRPAPGVLPFSINAEQWADHATFERLVAIPGSKSIRLHAKAERIPGSMFNRMMDFPKDSVLVKTLSLEMQHGNPSSRRRIETQLLHFDGRFWRGYTYEWNRAQTDAELVDSQGKVATFDVVDRTAPGGKRKQEWLFVSRNQCIRCHNPWSEHTLAFNVAQLNKDHDFGKQTDNQLRTLRHIGLLSDVVVEPDREEDPYGEVKRPKPSHEMPRLTNPHSIDPSASTREELLADLNARARSYLHVNCAHCHQFNGGGVAYISLVHDLAISKTLALGKRPTQGTFGIHDAEILAPGDPYRSILYFRINKLGAARMPHIGSKIIDTRGASLIHDWILQLPARVEDEELINKLASLDEKSILAAEKKNHKRTVWRIAKQIATADEREKPSAADTREAKTREQTNAENRANDRKEQRLDLINDLLSKTPRALILLRAIGQDRLPVSIRDQAIQIATKRPEPQIRDLFEQFVPDDQRSKRLGEVVDPAEILALPGKRDRGEVLFKNTAGVQCKNCHRVGELGTAIGPDLNQIGKRLKRSQILESILDPSKNIEPKFATWLVETTDGLVHSGLLVKRNDKEVVLRNAQNKEIQIAADNIEEMFPQRKSLMPDLQVRDLTAQQVADLLVYLESLK